jgi:lambda repressor-like predicted transcriptional regulator
VDWARLAAELEQACTRRHVSLRQVGRETGMSPSALTRLRRGESLTADAAVSVAAWLWPQRVPTWVTMRTGDTTTAPHTETTPTYVDNRG